MVHMYIYIYNIIYIYIQYMHIFHTLPTYLPTYIHTYIHTYIQKSVPLHIHTEYIYIYVLSIYIYICSIYIYMFYLYIYIHIYMFYIYIICSIYICNNRCTISIYINQPWPLSCQASASGIAAGRARTAACWAAWPLCWACRCSLCCSLGLCWRRTADQGVLSVWSMGYWTWFKLDEYGRLNMIWQWFMGFNHDLTTIQPWFMGFNPDLTMI